MKRQPNYPCPTCGGYARIPVENGNKVACARCGTVLTPLPFSTSTNDYIANPTPIRQGMKAMIGGKEFWAVGMIRYEEPEPEGGVSQWTEWVLMNPDGDIRYLEYDEGRWTLTEPIDPMDDGRLFGAFAASPGTVFTIGKYAPSVRETGTCSVDAFQGNIPWEIRRGERLRYVDLESDGGIVFSGELSEVTGEMEWFQGQRLEDRNVLTLFGLTHMLTELDRQQSRQKNFSGFGCLTTILAVIAFLFAGFAGARGAPVGQGTISAAQIPEEGYRFGPYKLNAVNRVYRLRISSQLSSTAMWVQGVIENSDSSPFFDVNQEFWDESGTDSDGAWHEWVLTAEREFRLDQSREVYVRLFADPDAAASNAPVSFVLEEGVLNRVPFIFYGIGALIVGVVFLAMGGSTRKVWEGMGS
ncbi:MAG: hypothetical protein OHK0029_23290 [Armatimonadaceae bacterium]